MVLTNSPVIYQISRFHCVVHISGRAQLPGKFPGAQMERRKAFDIARQK
jgi:hypothetical protein